MSLKECKFVSLSLKNSLYTLEDEVKVLNYLNEHFDITNPEELKSLSINDFVPLVWWLQRHSKLNNWQSLSIILIYLWHIEHAMGRWVFQVHHWSKSDKYKWLQLDSCTKRKALFDQEANSFGFEQGAYRHSHQLNFALSLLQSGFFAIFSLKKRDPNLELFWLKNESVITRGHKNFLGTFVATITKPPPPEV